jgi:hypothetical protein
MQKYASGQGRARKELAWPWQVLQFQLNTSDRDQICLRHSVILTLEIQKRRKESGDLAQWLEIHHYT